MNRYERYLVRMTDEVFNRAFEQGMTWIELANTANLAVTTVYNLGNRVTQYPQLRTFYLLAGAVGMNLELIQKEVKRHGQAA
jgi:hypothetical protein